MVGEVGHEGRGGRLEGRQLEAHRVAPVHAHVGVALERARERLLQPPVDLDCVHVRAALRQPGCERADARADLERDVLALQRGEPLDHAQQVVVDEEVLAELAIGPQAELRQACERDLARRAHGSAKTRAAFASTWSPSSSASTPRSSATARSVSST